MNKKLTRLLTLLLVACTTTTVFSPITAKADYTHEMVQDSTITYPLITNKSWSGTLLEYILANKTSSGFSVTYTNLTSAITAGTKMSVGLTYALGDIIDYKYVSGDTFYSSGIYYKYPAYNTYPTWIYPTNAYAYYARSNYTRSGSGYTEYAYGAQYTNIRLISGGSSTTYLQTWLDTTGSLTVTIYADIGSTRVLTATGVVPIWVLETCNSDFSYNNIKAIYDTVVPKNTNNKVTLPLLSKDLSTSVNISNLNPIDKLTSPLYYYSRSSDGDTSSSHSTSINYYLKPILMENGMTSASAAYSRIYDSPDTVFTAYEPLPTQTLSLPLSNTVARQAMLTQAGLPTTITTAGVYTNSKGVTYQVYTYTTPTTTGALNFN